MNEYVQAEPLGGLLNHAPASYRGHTLTTAHVPDLERTYVPSNSWKAALLASDFRLHPLPLFRRSFGLLQHRQRLNGVQPPVNFHDVAGEKIRPRVAQEGYHPGHIFPGAWTPARRFVIGLSLDILDPLLFVGAADVSGTDHVHGDPMGGFLLRQCLRERHQPYLGRRIYRPVRPSSRFGSMAEAEVNDAAPTLLPHLRQQGVIELDHAKQVAADEIVDLIARIIRE